MPEDLGLNRFQAKFRDVWAGTSFIDEKIYVSNNARYTHTLFCKINLISSLK